ncbi:MAG TPA: isoprenylcysteine carboxylmethyltransferase family protein [Longimicrobiales bacterium]|nr:isoprenylcysteine carboxylmethyltransferase family protein [Longimicrobiales bacterium]
MRKIRLRLVWLLLIPFLWLARPTPATLAAGGVLAVMGLLVRAWAAGFIRKEERLATSGPYGHTRNPLYLGSFFLGLGITVAGGNWYFVAAFLLFFFGVYGRTIRGEAQLMEKLFGEQYRHYAAHVPLFLPRLTRYRAPGDETPGAFSMERYRGNKEYEALLGAVAGFAFLALRMYLGG